MEWKICSSNHMTCLWELNLRILTKLNDTNYKNIKKVGFPLPSANGTVAKPVHGQEPELKRGN